MNEMDPQWNEWNDIRLNFQRNERNPFLSLPGLVHIGSLGWPRPIWNSMVATTGIGCIHRHRHYGLQSLQELRRYAPPLPTWPYNQVTPFWSPSRGLFVTTSRKGWISHSRTLSRHVLTTHIQIQRWKHKNNSRKPRKDSPGLRPLGNLYDQWRKTLRQ